MPSIVTPTDIANMALAACQTDTIASLNAQNERARKCNLFYEPCRRSALQSCNWSFAKITQKLVLIGLSCGAAAQDFPDWAQPSSSSANLTQLEQNAVPQYSYLYRYPTGCVFVRKVFNNRKAIVPEPYGDVAVKRNWGKRERFEILRSRQTNELSIGTNLECAHVRFTGDISDTSQFDEVFVKAFALFLAQQICLPLTGDKDLKGDIDKDLAIAISDARRINLSESPEELPRHSSYEDVRNWG